MGKAAESAALNGDAAVHIDDDRERLDIAAALADLPESDGRVGDGSASQAETLVERILSAAREHLDMEVAYYSEFTADDQVIRGICGESQSFGVTPGMTIPLPETYCQRVIEGRLSNVVRDAKRDERVRHLAVTQLADVGAYVGVPVRFADGRLYGTLCCASHAADPALGQRDVSFMRVLGRLLADHLERQEIERERQRHQNETIGLSALLAALDARDNYTGQHSQAVVELSVRVARELGLPEETIAEVEQVALLHDIGKLGIPDAILSKQGPLDDDEWELMRQHPTIGAQIVASIDSLSHLAPAVRAEHERWDGNGYPDGLAREQIPLASRITFACDAYHAMTSDRPYRKAMDQARAALELEANAGTQFDPGVIAALLRLIGEGRSAQSEASRARVLGPDRGANGRAPLRQR